MKRELAFSSIPEKIEKAYDESWGKEENREPLLCYEEEVQILKAYLKKYQRLGVCLVKEIEALLEEYSWVFDTKDAHGKSEHVFFLENLLSLCSEKEIEENK